MGPVHWVKKANVTGIQLSICNRAATCISSWSSFSPSPAVALSAFVDARGFALKRTSQIFFGLIFGNGLS